VRKAGAPLRLRAEADVVVHGDGDYRGARVGSEQHPETIDEGEPVQCRGEDHAADPILVTRDAPIDRRCSPMSEPSGCRPDAAVTSKAWW
jgi:hypothetical protein